MTEIQKIRSIASYKASMTRKLAKIDANDVKARKAIQKEYAKKIANVEKESNIKSVKCTCRKITNKEEKVRTYEIFERAINGRFVYLGKTTKNPFK